MATSLIAPGQAVDGSVWIQGQIVYVRWGWLSLPIALLVLSILSLLAAFVETRRKRICLWISSPLALYFNARPAAPSFDWRGGPFTTASAMKNAASELTAIIPKHDPGTIEIYKKDDEDELSRDDIKMLPRDSLQMDGTA
ncbi:hypothetical protein SCUP234_04075 [Seiridium cupressi]